MIEFIAGAAVMLVFVFILSLCKVAGRADAMAERSRLEREGAVRERLHG